MVGGVGNTLILDDVMGMLSLSFTTMYLYEYMDIATCTCAHVHVNIRVVYTDYESYGMFW